MTAVSKRFAVPNEHGVASNVTVDATVEDRGMPIVCIGHRDYEKALFDFSIEMSANDARILIGILHDALDFIEKWARILERENE